MRHISETVYEMLVRQGVNAGGLAGPMANGMKGPALSTMASSGEVEAVTAGGQRPPISRQEERPIRLAWVNPTAIGGRTELMRRPMLVIVR